MWETGAKGEEGWFRAMKCCCMEREHPDPAQPGLSLSLFQLVGRRTGGIRGHGCSPLLLPASLLPSHLGLSHSLHYPKAQLLPPILRFHCLPPQTMQRGKERRQSGIQKGTGGSEGEHGAGRTDGWL